MIRALWLPDEQAPQQGGLELIDSWRQQGGQLWVDFQGEKAGDERQLLRRNFDIPNLSIDDALRERHPPKLERLDNYLFLIWRGLHAQTDSMDFRTIQIAIWMAKDLLITRHSDDSPSIDKAWEQAVTAQNFDSQKVLYRILRNVVDRYTPVITGLEERLETIEDELITRPQDTLLSELLGYSRQLKKMRRILRYHERYCEQMLSDEVPEVSLHSEFQDVLEQNERLASLSDMYHDIVGDLINGYLSVSSHKLNQVMRILTVVTVILAPLSVLVGIYGMNFEHIPELKTRYGYFVLLGVMGSIVAGLIFLFRRRGWL
jgi:magnesium transporter